MNPKVKDFMSDYMIKVDTYALSEIEAFSPGIIASDPQTPKAILELFLISSDIDILEKLAANPSTPVDALIELSVHYDSRVKEAVIDNLSTPMEILMNLASDPDDDIRYYLAENHNVDGQVIQYLMQDQNPFVAARASTTWLRISKSQGDSRPKKSKNRFKPVV